MITIAKSSSFAFRQIFFERITDKIDFSVGPGGIERQSEFVVADVLAFWSGRRLYLLVERRIARHPTTSRPLYSSRRLIGTALTRSERGYCRVPG